MFNMVGFEPNEKQQKEFDDMFKKNNTMTCDQFLSIFSLKATPDFKPVDVKNAFRLLSKEYTKENKIALHRIEEILIDMQLPDDEI